MSFSTALLFTLSSLVSHAQQIDTSIPADSTTMADVLEHLDLTQVPNGLLLDQALQIADLTRYGGTLNDSNYVDAGLLRRIYGTLMGAVVSTGSQLPDYSNTLGNMSQSDTFPLKTIMYDYACFKSDAIDNNLLSISNNQLYDVPNRPESPYQEKQLLAAAPWKEKGGLAIGTYHFIPEMITNHGWGFLSHFSYIDFDDGNGFQLVNWSGMHTITYQTAGEKTITLRVVKRGTTDTLYTHSKLYVAPIAPPSPLSPVDVGNYCLGNIFTIPGITGAEVNYITACCIEPRIKKPLIIIDGFEGVGLEELFPDFTLNAVLQRLLNIGGLGQTGNNLLDDLEASRYDIIFVDFTNSENALENNAEVVREVLREVNTLKAGAGSTEENVVIGFSLGGLLGPLALLGMEENGEGHETELMISYDAPLRGANIPLAYQALVTHLNGIETTVGGITLGEFIPELQAALNTLNSPAAQQMLIYHLNQNMNSSSSTYRTFYESFSTMGINGDGELQNCKHVAVANGSQLSNGQGFDGGDLLFDFDATISDILEEWGDIMDGDIDFSNFWASVIEIFLPVKAKVEFCGFALPGQGQGTQPIYRGKVWASIFNIPVVLSYIKVSVTDNPNHWQMDNAPGGFGGFDIAVLENELGFMLDDVDFIDIPVERFNFVPTVSALGIGPFQSANQNLTDPFEAINNNAVILSRSIADEVVAFNNDPPGTLGDNTQHIDFNADNVGVIRMNALEEPFLVSTLSGSDIYNFGDSGLEFNYQSATPTFQIAETTNTIDEDLTISLGGELWINKFERIAFISNNNNPFNQNTSIFDLYITHGFCDELPVTVTVTSGALMELGEWNNSAGINNIGNVYVMADAMVEIADEGEVFVNKESEFIVEPGGRVEVQANGLLNAGFGGKIRVKDGGEVAIRGNGILRVFDDSRFIIEEGGKLTIDPGAKIQLWDPGNDPGRARIQVYGTLEVGGEFDFSGSHGFFDFYTGHDLSLPGGLFKLEGLAKGKRFIRLNNTSLGIGNNRIHLINGLVEYGGESKISAGDGGEAVVASVEMEGNSASTGLFLDGANILTVSNTDFDGFNEAIVGYDIYPSSPWLNYAVINSNFDNNGTTIQMVGCGTMRLIGTTITAGPQSTNGMILWNMEGVRLSSGTTVSGYSVPYPGAIDSWGAIMLQDVPEFILSNSTITNNDVGIYCPAGKKANVFMYSQAEISNHSSYGIHIEKGGIDDNGVDFGLVLMDCAKLLNNYAGVKGDDILLQIDAIENSGTDNPSYIRANHFEDGATGSLFDICYDDRDDITQVNAKGNYWGSDNTNPSLVAYGLHQKSGGCSGGSEVTLITADNAASEPTYCPSLPPGEPDHPNDVFCNLEVDGHIQVHEEYFYAYRDFVDALENDVSTYQARQEFAVPAGIPDAYRDHASQTCKHYIDVARVFLDMQHIHNPGGEQSLAIPPTQGEASSLQTRSLPDNIAIYPNPVSEQLYLANKASACQVVVYSAEGSLMRQFYSQEGLTEINVSTWPRGLYTFKLIAEQTGEQWVHKVIVQ